MAAKQMRNYSAETKMYKFQYGVCIVDYDCINVKLKKDFDWLSSASQKWRDNEIPPNLENGRRVRMREGRGIFPKLMYLQLITINCDVMKSIRDK